MSGGRRFKVIVKDQSGQFVTQQDFFGVVKERTGTMVFSNAVWQAGKNNAAFKTATNLSHCSFTAMYVSSESTASIPVKPTSESNSQMSDMRSSDESTDGEHAVQKDMTFEEWYAQR